MNLKNKFTPTTRISPVYTLIISVVILLLTFFPRWTVDDAYITFRYADNLAQHGEFTYNVGEDPVEGYTGVLLPVCVATSMRLGFAPETTTHLIGIGAFLLVLAFFHRLLARMVSSSTLRRAFFWLIASAAFLYLHVFSGLETLLFMALLLGSAVQLNKLLKSRSVSFLPHAGTGLLLLGLSLCRPEGAAFALITIAVLASSTLFKLKSIRPTFAFILTFFVPGLLYFIWRWNYYGYLLPNTFHAKLSGAVSWDTVQTTLSFAKRYFFFPLLALAATYLFARGPSIREAWRNREKLTVPANFITLGSLVLFAGIVMVHYLRSKLAMNFSYRFYAPLYPIALLAVAALLSPAFNRLREQRLIHSRRYRMAIFILSLLLVAQTGVQLTLLARKEIPYAYGFNKCMEEMHRAAGRYLKNRIPPDEWLAVHIDAGAIPYYSGLKTADFGNLNNEFLAHLGNDSMAERIDYLFALAPAAIAITADEWNRIDYSEESKAIVSDPRFEQYALVQKYGNSVGVDYFQFIYLRRDLLQPGEEIPLTAE